LITLSLPQGEWSYADGAPLGPPGGFAAVYPGLSSSGQPVAVKVFRSTDPRHFKRELEFASDRFGKTSDHVTPIFGFGVDPTLGRACIVMAKGEYSLAQKLAMDGPFSEAAAVAIAHDIVKGLKSVTWVHRDLKPANVLWVDSRWQLTDFGIARQADANTAASTMKDFLSAEYAAPEQWNDEHATHKTDVYALGCALLDHLLNDQADELQQIARRTAERLDDIEDALLAGRDDRTSTPLAGLRRLMVRLQRLLAPEPSALTRTLSRPPRWVAEDDEARLLRTNEEFALVLRDIGALQERIKLLQDESATRVAEENNRSLFILTMVTVLALPINLTAGLMGMNVGGIPLAESRLGFWATLAFIALLTGAVAWLITWRLRHRRR
jgi:serine/threonine protein kinase